MKIANKLLVICCFVSCFGAIGADSQRVWPIITFTCDKENNELKIKNEVKWGKAGENFAFTATKGTYNPWQLVKIEAGRGGKKVVEADSLQLSCHLFGGEYRVIVRPLIFNPNFEGRCGDRLSGIVSIYRDSETLLENKELEPFCSGNTLVVRGIKVKGTNKKVKIYEVPRSRFY